MRRLSVALTPTQAVLLLASMATALALRLHGLDADLNHDEAFTWQSFASQPYGEIVSAYPVPNNHIFHSILVRIASRIFGAGEIAIRLPALLAGLAAIPAVFLLGRALFQRTPPALLAAWILALSPAHISFSQVARGYSLLLLFASLSFLCLHRAIQHRESGSGLWWVGFVCFSFFSAYTVPSGILHLVVLVVWGIGTQRASPRLMGRIALAGAVSLALAVAAYWPIRTQVMAAGEHWGRSLEGLAMALTIPSLMDFEA